MKHIFLPFAIKESIQVVADDGSICTYILVDDAEESKVIKEVKNIKKVEQLEEKFKHSDGKPKCIFWGLSPYEVEEIFEEKVKKLNSEGL